jgi:hypothetical protein
MANTTLLPLKLQNSSKLLEFIEWYEMAYQTTNPDTGRKRKGNGKKFLTEAIEGLLSSGKVSASLAEAISEFKKASLLSPEVREAKGKLSETDFAKFVELMEKVKAGS